MLRHAMNSCSYEVIFILCLPIQVLSFGLKIEGLIDLGPKWNYEYRLSPIDHGNAISNESVGKSNSIENNHLDIFRLISNNDASVDKEGNKVESDSKHDDYDNINNDKIGNNHKTTKKAEKSPKKHYKFTKQFIPLRSTHFSDDVNAENADAYVNANKDHKKDEKKIKHVNLNGDNLNGTKLKDNTKIVNFIKHILKQSLNVFDKVKDLSDDLGTKQKIEALKTVYIKKFGEYLNETKEHKLKTKLATQNVILNTIDTSNNILKRLANRLSLDNLDGYNIKRNSDISKIFAREIKIETDIENKHACNRFGVCRTDEQSDFFAQVLKIILQTDDTKIKKAANAMTETVKNTDMSNLIDFETEKKLHKLMDDIDTWGASMTRSMFVIINTVIKNKNRPISIIDKIDIKLANRTAAFYDFIDILNKNIDTGVNKMKQEESLKELEDWRDGKRGNVQSIIEDIIKRTIDNLEKLSYEIRQRVSELFKLLVKR